MGWQETKNLLPKGDTTGKKSKALLYAVTEKSMEFIESNPKTTSDYSAANNRASNFCIEP